MIAEFLKHAYCFEGLATFATKKGFDIRALDEVVVQVHLKRSEIAKHHMLILDRKVFGEDVVGAANDEFVDQG